MSGMPVLLAVNVTARLDQTKPLTDMSLRKLHNALTKSLQAVAEHTTAEIATTFQPDNATSGHYLCIVIVRPDTGHGTKIVMKPFTKYLDTDEALTVQVDKYVFTVDLTSKVVLWTGKDEATRARVFHARDMVQSTKEFVRVYVSDVIMESDIGRGIYQSLSKLLYCIQLQLNETEYFDRSDLVIVNVTAPTFPIFDYFKTSSSQVRVCADAYLRKSNGNEETSSMSYRLVIACFAIVIVVNILD